MPTTYASPDDVEHARSDDDPQWDDQKVQNLLEEAEDLVGLRRDLTHRISQGRTTAKLVRRVVIELVLGVLRNEGGYSSRSGTQGAGPFTMVESRSYGEAAPGRLVLTKDQRRLLGDKLGGIRTANPSRGHPPLPWVATSGWC